MSNLDRLLRELAETDRDAKPSSAVEQALLARVRTKQAGKPRPWRWAAAAAAVIALAAAWALHRPQPEQPLVTHAPAQAPAQPQPGQVSEFYFIPTGRPIASLRSGRLVRVTLPSTAPSYFGLPPLPADQGVEADVLLGDDGVAQAVRFVY